MASTAFACLPPWVVASWSPKTWAEGSPVQVSTLLHEESESHRALEAARKKEHQRWPAAKGGRAGKLGIRLEVGLDRASKCPPLPPRAQAYQALQRAGRTPVNLIGWSASQSERSQADLRTQTGSSLG